MRYLALAALLLVACVEDEPLPGPTVYLTLADAYHLKPIGPTSWSVEDRAWIERGAMQWRRLGFDVRPLDEAPPADAWVIMLYRDAWFAEQADVAGLTSRARRVTFVHGGLHDFALMHVIAHELGHHLLDTAEHLEGDEHGVMDPSGLGYWTLTADDLAFACRVAGLCEEYAL